MVVNHFPTKSNYIFHSLFYMTSIALTWGWTSSYLSSLISPTLGSCISMILMSIVALGLIRVQFAMHIITVVYVVTLLLTMTML